MSVKLTWQVKLFKLKDTGRAGVSWGITIPLNKIKNL